MARLFSFVCVLGLAAAMLAGLARVMTAALSYPADKHKYAHNEHCAVNYNAYPYTEKQTAVVDYLCSYK